MKTTNKQETFSINVLVALNTLQHFKRASAKGVYFNSPDNGYFDGSAEGYWKRVAIACGATKEEVAQTP